MARRTFNWDKINEQIKATVIKSSGSFEPIDDTISHPAKLVGLTFCGEEESTFNGETKIKNNMIMIFALGKDKPRVFSTKVAISSHEKSKLMKYLSGWGKEFADLGPSLIDQDALLFFENKDGKDRDGNPRVYTNLTRVAKPKDEYTLSEDVYAPKWIVGKYGETNIACGERLLIPELD